MDRYTTCAAAYFLYGEQFLIFVENSFELFILEKQMTQFVLITHNMNPL